MRFDYLKAGLILGVLLLFFSSASAASAGGNTILIHNSSSSLDGQTIWVKSNSTTPFSINFTNDLTSMNNITQIRFWTSGLGILLNNVSCPTGWNKTSEGDDVKCISDTELLQPGDVLTIDADVLSSHVSITTLSVWRWFTTDDNASYTADGNFSIGIDLTAPEINITSPLADSLNQGVFEINFSANETEVALDLNSIILETNCSNGTLSYTNDTSDCNAEGSFCNITITLNSTINITDGYCAFNISINDTFQNKGVAEINLTIDNNAPTIVLNSPANESAINSGTLLNFTVTDTVAVDSTWYSIDNGATNISLPADYDIDTTGWTEANTTVIVWANDSIGNIAEENYFFIIDDSGPNITITAPLDGAVVYKGATLTVKANVSDEGAGITATRCRTLLNGVFAGNIDYYPADNECRGTISISSSLTTGIKTLEVTINDSINNSNTAAITIDVRNRPSGGGGVSFVKKVENQQPELTAPKVEPELPYAEDVLTCISGIYSDPDGDSMDAQEWAWYLNEQQLQENTNVLNLSEISVKPGDEIYCKQRVSDGERYSNWMSSSNKAIVQEEQEIVELVEETILPEEQITQPTTGGLTGAFIGAFGNSGLEGTVVLIGILSALGTFLFLRFSGNRKKHFILR